jgi:hypothetical protein
MIQVQKLLISAFEPIQQSVEQHNQTLRWSYHALASLKISSFQSAVNELWRGCLRIKPLGAVGFH